jgi:hypothetical protein
MGMARVIERPEILYIRFQGEQKYFGAAFI